MNSLLKKSAWGAAFALSACAHAEPQGGEYSARVVEPLILSPCNLPGVEDTLRCGVYYVPEDRSTGRGRMLPLRVVVIPARSKVPDNGPVFFFSGGPGQSATELAGMFAELWERENRDVVLVDERGAGPTGLRCSVLTSDDDLESYLNSVFRPEVARHCKEELEK